MNLSNTDCPHYQYCDRMVPPSNNRCIYPHGHLETAHILIVGIAPGTEERRRGQFFVGPTGVEVYAFLQDAGIDHEDCVFTNVFHKQPPRDGQGKQTDPSSNMIKACLQQTILLIDSMPNLRVIITLGALPTRVLTNVTKITKGRGVYKQLLFNRLPKYVRHLFVEYFGSKLGARIEDAHPTKKVAPNPEKSVAQSLEKEYDYTVVAKHVDSLEIQVMPTLHPAYLLRNEMKGRELVLEDFRLARDLAYGNAEESELTQTFILDTPEGVLLYLDWLLYHKHEIPLLAVDIETDSKYFEMSKRILCIGITHEYGKAWIIPIAHPKWTYSNSDIARFLPTLKRVLAELPIVGANFAFDWSFLWDHLGIENINMAFDVTYASAFIYTGTKSNDLETIVTTMTDAPNHKQEFQKYILEHPKECDPEHQSGKGNYGNVPPEILFPYCGGDVDATLRAAFTLKEKLLVLGAYEDFVRHKIKLLRGVVEMAVNGIAVDSGALRKIEEELARKLKRLKASIQQLEVVKKFLAVSKKDKYNHNAHQQTRDVIYTYGGVPKEEGGITKTGASSTDGASLEKIKSWCKKQDPVPPVLEFINVLQDLKSTDVLKRSYVSPILKWLRGNRTQERPYAVFSRSYHPNTVHPLFYFGDGASTGRARMKDPPMHSMTGITKRPIVSRYGKKGLILCCDAKQLEIRVLAMLTQDPKLSEVIRSGKDPHSMSASVLFGVPFESITDEMRDKSKTGNFAVIYQKSPKALAEDMGFTVEAVLRVFDIYFETYSCVKPWMEQIKSIIASQGGELPRVQTPYGHWRVLPIMNENNYGEVAERERKAVNFMVQGTAALICHQGIFYHLSNYLRTLEFSKLLLQTHDCAVLDTVSQEFHGLFWNTKRCMEREVYEDFFNGIPIEIDAKIGFNWCDQCKIEGYTDGYHLKGDEKIVHQVTTLLVEENKWEPTLLGLKEGQAEVFLRHNLPIPDLTPQSSKTF